ncbi:alkaline phosphatase family protein [Peteryoungia ipomoeae]|uniref:Alkaline phosphatase family protein n=1 Tax=Peteryoungia ipomoeae TaxID=1210932 RepID=A0A4S8NZP1_9HYPH|nr:alkaline phosphatase family protein [Peteryoungia ipomoeae]THV22335.1 alkaline phosphatase family protein [Peteryoungia ipomoeae]
MSKVILIVLDGLRYDAARTCLGYLEGLVAAGRADVRKLTCELPAMSRPLYETLLTGRVPVDHGVVSNGVVRRSLGDNVFSRVRAAGKVTAAAAYSWVSELYVSFPFDRHRDRILVNGEGDITHGIFYWDDHYPDSHLFADAEWLIRAQRPDFLLLHPMNVDDAGHKHGGDSVGYRNAARVQGDLLARHVPGWIEEGYTIIVTADHGMGNDGNHAGPTADETEVPFYTLGFRFGSEKPFRQTEIAGLVCRLMDVDPGALPAFDHAIERL